LFALPLSTSAPAPGNGEAVFVPDALFGMKDFTKLTVDNLVKPSYHATPCLIG